MAKEQFNRRMGALVERLRHCDLMVLFAGLVIVIGSWFFLELAGEVLEGDTRYFDRMVVHSLRQPDNPALARGPWWLGVAAADITSLGSAAVLVLVCLIVVGFLLIQHKYGAMLLVMIAPLTGMLLSTLLKIIYNRPRPDIPHMTQLVTPSFPSGHAMLSAVVYLSLGSLLARMESRRSVRIYFIGVAMLLTLLVGITRVYLGYHYPTDVLAGWSAGLVWAVFCWLAARYLQQRGAVEKR